MLATRARGFHLLAAAPLAATVGCHAGAAPGPAAPPHDVVVHLAADDDARGVELYEETTGAAPIARCREPCDVPVASSGAYYVARGDLRRSAGFHLEPGPGSQRVSLDVTTRRPRAALWTTGVGAVLYLGLGAMILADCSSDGDCNRNKGGLVSFGSPMTWAVSSFVVGGALAAVFTSLLLLVPERAHVAATR